MLDNSSPIRLTGLVVDEPDVRDNYINLRLRAEKLQRNEVSQIVEGLVLVRAPRYPEYAYGDRLAVTGSLETPPVFEDFSYKLEKTPHYFVLSSDELMRRRDEYQKYSETRRTYRDELGVL